MHARAESFEAKRNSRSWPDWGTNCLRGLGLTRLGAHSYGPLIPGHLYAHKAISGPILFWEDSWEDFASASGGLYLDVMAEGDKRVIVLKAADVPAEERASLFEAVAATAPSGSKAPARRSLRGNTFRVRIWDVTGDSPATGAAVALDAQRYLRSFAASR